MSRKLITFAGPGGVGKTPVAIYLSWNLGWGVFSNDAIRLELSDDLERTVLSDPEFQQLRDERFKAMIELGHNLIIDSSMDRQWSQRGPQIAEQNIKTFLISFDLSPEFIHKLYQAKGYDEQFVKGWLTDHQNFLDKYADDVRFSVTDQNFADRMELSLQAVQNWVNAGA